MAFIRRGDIPKDFLTEVQKGNVEGHSGIFRAGRIEDAGIALNSISFGITGIVPKKSVASQFHVSSASVNDTLAGSGAEAVFLAGLDADFNEQGEIIVLDGTSVISSVNDYIGFPLTLAVTHPTGGQYPLFTERAAQGEITVYDDVGENTPVMKIGISGGLSLNFGLHAAYIVPLGHTLFIHQFTAGSNEGKDALVSARVQFNGGITSTLISFDLFESVGRIPLLPPSNLPEKASVELTAFASQGEVDVFAAFEATLVENKFIGQFFALF